MATINMHMKFEIEIPKQTWLMLRKPCRLQTDGLTDGQTDKVNPVYPPPTSLGGGIISYLWLDIGLVPNRLHANIWTNDDRVHWRIYVSLCWYCQIWVFQKNTSSCSVAPNSSLPPITYMLSDYWVTSISACSSVWVAARFGTAASRSTYHCHDCVQKRGFKRDFKEIR